MKLRIQGNTIRLRLTMSEVDSFGHTHYIEDKTEFVNSVFHYALNAKAQDSIVAEFANGKLEVSIPAALAKEWTTTDLVTLHGEMETSNGKKLDILIEKDFKCLDDVMEDQSDHYENPRTKKKKPSERRYGKE